MATRKQIACLKCQSYFVTYDKNRPWGCSRFGFKSSILPSQLVFNTTGTNCAYFVKKVNLKDQKEQPVRNVRMT
tara:strand:- start:584 stop:805 length:222 start_codon:yes stop_codon:yes gene_type:complete